jgi:hypothetical protein
MFLCCSKASTMATAEQKWDSFICVASYHCVKGIKTVALYPGLTFYYFIKKYDKIGLNCTYCILTCLIEGPD